MTRDHYANGVELIDRAEALKLLNNQLGEDTDCQWTRGNNSAIRSAKAIIAALPPANLALIQKGGDR